MTSRHWEQLSSLRKERGEINIRSKPLDKKQIIHLSATEEIQNKVGYMNVGFEELVKI